MANQINLSDPVQRNIALIVTMVMFLGGSFTFPQWTTKIVSMCIAVTCGLTLYFINNGGNNKNGTRTNSQHGERL